MPWSDARPKSSSTSRGYGKIHRFARAAAALRHQPSDLCARCGHALGPMGPWLHFDHTDERDGYLGFSHGGRDCPVCRARCNLKAGAQKGRRLQGAVKRVVRVIDDRW